jgi:hypothetical protein
LKTASDGALYDPVGDAWSALSVTNAPTGRHSVEPLSTGTTLIFGPGDSMDGIYGFDVRTYTIASATWQLVSTRIAPYVADGGTTYGWSGSQLLAWGCNRYANTCLGQKYNPTTDSWSTMTTTSQPSFKQQLTGGWSGTSLVVWGGYGNGNGIFQPSGARYTPGTDSWSAVSTVGAPTTAGFQMVWIGSKGYLMENDAVYDASADTWAPMSSSGKVVGTATAMGSKIFVIGSGRDAAVYDPSNDSWTATATAGIPLAEDDSVVAWNGSKVLVFGGYDSNSYSANYPLDTHHLYDPATNTWSSINLNGSPFPGHAFHIIVENGKFLLWGGQREGCRFSNSNSNMYCDSAQPIANGAIYDPGTNSWQATSTVNAPDPSSRSLMDWFSATSVWSGTQMILWDPSGDPVGWRYAP